MARPGLTGHRKFRRLARLLHSRIMARGALELLWESCYESGDDYVGTAQDIETLVGWDGEPGVLATALVQAGAPEGQGFIEPVSDGSTAFRVHDLWHHAPDYVAKRRQREMDRQQKSDPAVRRTAPNGGHWRASPDCSPGVGRTPSPSHSPSPSPKNVSADTSAPFLVFPAIGTDREFPLSEAQVAEWAELYPVIDVRAECRKALAWVKANPGRQKTAKGMPRFLNSWIARAVDSGRGSQAIPPAAARTQREEWVCPHEPKCLGRGACHILERIRLGKKQAHA